MSIVRPKVPHTAMRVESGENSNPHPSRGISATTLPRASVTISSTSAVVEQLCSNAMYLPSGDHDGTSFDQEAPTPEHSSSATPSTILTAFDPSGSAT